MFVSLVFFFKTPRDRHSSTYSGAVVVDVSMSFLASQIKLACVVVRGLSREPIAWFPCDGQEHLRQ